MSQTSTDMAPATIAKSDQINADDLIGGAITVTVRGAVRHDRTEQPAEVDIGTPGKVYRPCKTMVRALMAVWGPDGNQWIGQKMTLYRDPSVRFGADPLGGIRVSHVSGITEAVELWLTSTRGKKTRVRLEPLLADLVAVLESIGLPAAAVDAWATSKGRRRVSDLGPDERAKFAAWLRSQPRAKLDEIRNAGTETP